MKRWVMVLIIAVSLGGFSMGVFAAYAMHRISYAAGQMHSSAEWYKQATDIERQLIVDGRANVGDWMMVVDKRNKRLVHVKRNQPSRPAVNN